jgi:predicted dienelactone hydrolase
MIRTPVFAAAGLSTVLALALVPSGAAAEDDLPRTTTAVVALPPAMKSDFRWLDPLRGREIPATIYYPANAGGPLPVIIFSHGLGRSREDYAYLGRHWASHGYVAVLVQHPGSDQAVRQKTVRPIKALREAWEDPVNAMNRRRDLIFAIDQLERMKIQNTPLGSWLDLGRIGVAGNDFGAQTALVLAGQTLPGQITRPDPRVKAVVAMSPPVPQRGITLAEAYEQIHLPCLYMTGTQDDGLVGATKADQRRLPFEYTFGADQYLLTFRGADHMIYCGHVLDRTRGQNDAMFQRLICISSTAFWDAYLKDHSGMRNWMIAGGLNTTIGRHGWVERKLGGNDEPGEVVSSSSEGETQSSASPEASRSESPGRSPRKSSQRSTTSPNGTR